jgi:hypothetical protein
MTNMAKTKVVTKPAVKPALKTRTKEAPKDDRKEAKRLIEVIQESWFDFSQVVARVYHENKWADWNYKDFEACCKGEWGREYRDMMNRVKAGDAIQKFGISKEQAKKCGWTNFMEMASVFDSEMKPTEIDRLITKASKMTHDQLVNFKKELRTGKSGGQETTRLTMAFRFLNEQAALVQKILEHAKELFDTPNEDIALENALVDWYSGRSDDKKDVAKLRREVAARLKADHEANEEGEEETEEEEAKPKRKERADKGATKKKVATKAKTKKKANEDEEEDEEAEEEDEDLLDDEAEEEEDDAADDDDDSDEDEDEDDELIED